MKRISLRTVSLWRAFTFINIVIGTSVVVDGQYTITTSEGVTVQLPCETLPNTSVNWQFRPALPARDLYVCIHGKVMKDFRARVSLVQSPSGNSSLTINHVNTSDSGLYTCVADNGAGRRHHNRLTVLRTHTYSEIHATPGEVVHLACLTAVQTWFLWIYQPVNASINRTTIISENGHVLVEHRQQFELRSVDKGDYTLTVTRVQLQDAGLYTCIEDEGGFEGRHTVRLSLHADNAGVVTGCGSNPCSGYATCISSNAHNYTCECPAGFTGKHCEIDVDECSSVPCQHDGVCVDGVNKFTCVCLNGYTGTRCQQFVGTRQISTTQASPAPAVYCPSTSGYTIAIVVLATILVTIVTMAFIVLARKKIRNILRRLRRKSCSDYEVIPLNSALPCGESSQTINKYVWVCGVTVVDNKLYMLRGHLIQVYNTSTFDFLQGKHIGQMKRHYRNDMTSCKVNNCLYISDYQNKCIFKLQLPLHSEGEMTEHHTNQTSTTSDTSTMPSTDGGADTRFRQIRVGLSRTDVDYRPCGLSVTHDNNLLITCVNDHRLVLLSPEEKMIREIQLESDIELPLHAVEVPPPSTVSDSAGQYIVSHTGDGVWWVGVNVRENDSNDGNNNTTVMAENKLSYSGAPGSDRRLAWPCHVAVSTNSDVNKDNFVFVADNYNDRIVVLNSDLEFVRHIKLDKTYRVRRLYLDEENQRLYVGLKDGNVGRVDNVFSHQNN